MTIVDLLYRNRRGMGVVGHRGSRATHPENSLAAFRHAIDCGADAVELDIVVTADGQLAVTHDPVDCAFHNLPQGIPKLEEVLALASGNDLIFDIEMKECGRLTPSPDDYACMLLERLQAPELDHRIMVRSFEHSFLRAVHARRPDLPLVALIEETSVDWLTVTKAAHALAISPHFSAVTPEQVEAAHAADIAVMPWTVNDPADWRRFADIGVDALITDDPAALIEFIEPARYSSKP